ncbi:MAG: hypothetical protein RL291_983, partial [Pseudomonadota bacterium]
MQRRTDWAERLMDHIARQQGLAFAWGRADCGTLFAGAVESVTGINPLAPFGVWTTEREAMEVLARMGVPSIFEFCVATFRAIQPADARRGDVGFTRSLTRLTCPAVITGAEAVSRDANGWIAFPRCELAVAFQVGE